MSITSDIVEKAKKAAIRRCEIVLDKHRMNIIDASKELTNRRDEIMYRMEKYYSKGSPSTAYHYDRAELQEIDRMLKLLKP